MSNMTIKIYISHNILCPLIQKRFLSIKTNSAYISEQAKQHVGVERSLVSLVHHNGTVVIQIRLPERLTQQDTICHVLDQCALEWKG